MTGRPSRQGRADSGPALLITGAGQLLTLRGPRGPRRGADLGRLGLVRNGAVPVRGGTIVAAGPAGPLLRRAETLGADIVADIVALDAVGRVVMPAFVDSHTHMAFAAPRLADYEMRLAGRSYQQIARAGSGIQSSVARCREATPDSLAAFAKRALEHGTATVEVKSGYGLELGAHVAPRGVAWRAASTCGN